MIPVESTARFKPLDVSFVESVLQLQFRLLAIGIRQNHLHRLMWLQCIQSYYRYQVLSSDFIVILRITERQWKDSLFISQTAELAFQLYGMKA
jgi:hypothetical protein